MSNSAYKELLFIAVMMLFIFIFALGAVFIFVRQWRREKTDGKKPSGR
jgi:heme/copper-type cytochrome/quinol oxidase subunit 2